MQTDHNLLLPMLLVAAGGLLAGIFAFPMERIRSWNWENIWFAYSCFGFLLIPFLAVNSTVPNLRGVYQSVPLSCLIAVIAAGYAFGWGSALFGVGIHRLGMGLGFSLILGITTVLGALAALLFTGTGSIHMSWLLSGLLLLVFGLTFCGRAGALRNQTGMKASSPGSYLAGLILCVLSGCLSAAFNLGVAASQPIQDAARTQGAAGWAAANAFLAVAAAGRVSWERDLLRHSLHQKSLVRKILVRWYFWLGHHLRNGGDLDKWRFAVRSGLIPDGSAWNCPGMAGVHRADGTECLLPWVVDGRMARRHSSQPGLDERRRPSDCCGPVSGRTRTVTQHQAKDRWKRVDIPFNNSEIVTGDEAHILEDEERDCAFVINTKSMFLFCQGDYSMSLEQSAGLVLNMSSTTALRVAADQTLYNFTNSAVLSFTGSMALDYSADEIRVNCLRPGTIDTPLLNVCLNVKGNAEELRKQFNTGYSTTGCLKGPVEIRGAMQAIERHQGEPRNG